MNILPIPLAPFASYRQFIVYYLRPHPTKPHKTDKIPVNHGHGWRCSLTDPKHWTSYEQAALAARTFASRPASDWPNEDGTVDVRLGYGVGFVFTRDDPFFFLDVDNALVDGAWSPVALDLYASLPGAAWEVSQSGTGLHAFGCGSYPDGLKVKNPKYGIELYHRDRFAALTCNLWGDGGNAANHVPQIADVAMRYLEPQTVSISPADWTTEAAPGWDTTLADDAELIRRMLASRSATDMLGTRDGTEKRWTVQQLWAGENLPEGLQNEADGALAAHLAFWTGKNCERIESLMRQSGMVREKWDSHRTYMHLTITKAVAKVSKIATPRPVEPAPPAVESPATGGRMLCLTAEQAQDKADTLTIEYWLAAAGVHLQYDEFADSVIMNGTPLTDNREREVWIAIREQSILKIPKDLFGEVVRNLAWQNRFHPVRQYLDAQVWDGRPRIDSWLSDFLGVPRSPYTDAVGAIFLVAAVRRIRSPGCKFDEMLVIEGPQGIEKSTAFEALCPNEDWFTDNINLAMTTKEMMEATAGKWIVEAPEMSKMSNSEIEHVKAMLSRRRDRARMAYERNTTETGREYVIMGTTNGDKYLRDQTGNRRFWPALASTIDVPRLIVTRDQLWAEAAAREAAGASIRLPRALWAQAGLEQAARMADDPMADKLAVLLGDMTGRVRGVTLLDALRVPNERQAIVSRWLGDTMRKAGWENKLVSVKGEKIKFYVKGDQAREITSLGGNLTYAPTVLNVA